jgi:hypothetical protein
MTFRGNEIKRDKKQQSPDEYRGKCFASGGVCWKQTMHIKIFEGSKVNISSTKYEKPRLKLHFLSTNS